VRLRLLRGTQQAQCDRDKNGNSERPPKIARVRCEFEGPEINKVQDSSSRGGRSMTGAIETET